MPILDAYTNVVASPGLRTKDSFPYPGDYAIVGPNFTGTLPEGMKSIQVPTDMSWILGRTETFGEADIPNVNAIQQQYKLTPLYPSQQDKDTPHQRQQQDDLPTPPVIVCCVTCIF